MEKPQITFEQIVNMARRLSPLERGCGSVRRLGGNRLGTVNAEGDSIGNPLVARLARLGDVGFVELGAFIGCPINPVRAVAIGA